MGAVVNMRPDLFNAVIMGVPFLDVLTTMLDDSIPLTIIEKEEWGDPNVSAAGSTHPRYGWGFQLDFYWNATLCKTSLTCHESTCHHKASACNNMLTSE